MRVLHSQASGFSEQLAELLDRESETAQGVEDVVSGIIHRIRAEGDKALLELTRQFDRLDIHSANALELTQDRVEEIVKTVDPEVSAALAAASQRIREYHEREVNTSWRHTAEDGTVLGQKITPLDRVGVYVPGGKAAYPSSVMMTAIPASVAGVDEVMMVVPTPDGEINSAVVLAATLSGVDRIFTIGGAQAVAALAYGTETIPAVDKIVGPGNIYVATAKKQVFGKVGIDMIAGPSEVTLICDDNANPDWVAMDLFAQAEHDELAQSIVITDSAELVDKIQASVERLLPTMERQEIIEAALEAQGAIILVPTLEDAAMISNSIAPEHLELMVADPELLNQRIKHAGAIFMGRYSAESLGDYCAGPNHVLPTAGTARFSSPLGVYDYQKRSSIIFASQSGADEMAKIASVLARCEGLTAHARSAEYRLKSDL
ncbi:MAG: histidinol dehydrogenase [Acidiferrobacterales bacterium]|nr:histidinol dehydrogenase [Acidiferrobacterales bacterium]